MKYDILDNFYNSGNITLKDTLVYKNKVYSFKEDNNAWTILNSKGKPTEELFSAAGINNILDFCDELNIPIKYNFYPIFQKEYFQFIVDQLFKRIYAKERNKTLTMIVYPISQRDYLEIQSFMNKFEGRITYNLEEKEVNLIN